MTYIIAYVKTQKNRFIIHYVKPTAQLLFRIRFPKGGPTCRRQVVNPLGHKFRILHQTFHRHGRCINTHTELLGWDEHPIGSGIPYADKTLVSTVRNLYIKVDGYEVCRWGGAAFININCNVREYNTMNCTVWLPSDMVRARS